MNKFIPKFFVIFVTFISLLFFSLIYFNKFMMRNMHPMPPTSPASQNFQVETPDFNELPRPLQGPPISIPIIFIVLMSSGFVYLVLKYINKNYIAPLINIEDNIQKIKKGNLETVFSTDSEDKTIKETFCVLNEMVNDLKEKENLRDNFIRSLVHDLRAPVVAQERAFEILGEEFSDNELVKGLSENNNVYLKLINNIIDTFSQKEIKIDKIEFNFAKLVDNVISTLKPVIDEKNIKIEKNIDDNFMIWADYTSLYRIVTNIVYNAIENIECDKIIKISALKNPDNNKIIIEDNGQGMSDNQIKTIFEKHITRSNSENKLISGIGLSVVHDLVIRNEGAINAESTINKYTRFNISLPQKPMEKV